MLVANVNFDTGEVRAKAGETVVVHNEKLLIELVNKNIVKMVENKTNQVLETSPTYNYDDMTARELREICREKGLALSGTKGQLIKRLNR